MFAKFNGNHLLMANIFKLYEYQTLGLMKMDNMNKIKNNIFDGPLIVNQTFLQTEFDIGKSDFSHIMDFH